VRRSTVRRQQRRATLAALAAAGALALAGCGGDDDNGDGGEDSGNEFSAQVEERLKEGISEEPGASNQLDIGPSVRVTGVECPEDIEQRAGEKFDCEMKADDLKDDVELSGTVTVTLKDAEGEKLEYQTDLTGPGKTVKQSGTL
jgi:hypothetical protein